MPLLLYCVFLGDAQVTLPVTGVKGNAVHLLSNGELAAAYSELEQTEFKAVDLRQAALEFHEVVHAMFVSRAVLPFRFPTWLTADRLREHLDQQTEQYTRFLREHALHVQMEIRVVAKAEAQAAAGSGTEYLRMRSTSAQQLQVAADEFKAEIGEIVSDWRESPTPDGLRLFALVDRAKTAEFRERLSRAANQNISSRVTGPWPATEFLPQAAQGGVQP